ncbi:MAG: hypothetical protein JW816_01605 [Candidatus Buchananbacteria bacterium]|nr:hypothetical protein [Candidatus Buchananbacteria bacterium]
MEPTIVPPHFLEKGEVRLLRVNRLPDYFDFSLFLRDSESEPLRFVLDATQPDMIIRLNQPYQPNLDLPAQLTISPRRILGNVFWEINATATIGPEQLQIYGWLDQKNKRGLFCPANAIYKSGLLFYLLFMNGYCRFDGGGPVIPKNDESFSTKSLTHSILGYLYEIGATSNYSSILGWFMAIAFSQAKLHAKEEALSHCLINGFATNIIGWPVARDAAFVFTQEFTLSLVGEPRKASHIKDFIVEPAITFGDEELMKMMQIRLNNYHGKDNSLTERIKCWEPQVF